MPVAILRAVTSTPGIKAPLASATVPPTTAFTCAKLSMGASARVSTSATNKPLIVFTLPPHPPIDDCRVAYTSLEQGVNVRHVRVWTAGAVGAAQARQRAASSNNRAPFVDIHENPRGHRPRVQVYSLRVKGDAHEVVQEESPESPRLS